MALFKASAPLFFGMLAMTLAAAPGMAQGHGNRGGGESSDRSRGGGNSGGNQGANISGGNRGGGERSVAPAGRYGGGQQFGGGRDRDRGERREFRGGSGYDRGYAPSPCTVDAYDQYGRRMPNPNCNSNYGNYNNTTPRYEQQQDNRQYRQYPLQQPNPNYDRR